MKVALKDNKKFVLRFDKGEDVIAGLKDFLQSRKISACAFFGIGSTRSVELGYYDTASKSYIKKVFNEDMEVISVAGNGGLLDNGAIIHAHGSFSRKDYSIIGGHIFSLITSATNEINLTVLDGKLERKHNEELNLNLLI